MCNNKAKNSRKNKKDMTTEKVKDIITHKENKPSHSQRHIASILKISVRSVNKALKKHK
jgi:DNA-binding MarR family transcriptional regulator